MVLATALGGCVRTPPAASRPFTDVPPLSEGGDAELTEQWWTAFEDDALSERIDRALGGNFNVAAAWARLAEAEAFRSAQRSQLRPTLDGIADASRRESSSDNDSTTLSLGLRAGYEVDLWGRLRAQLRAEELLTLATAADLKSAALSLSAEVTQTWFELATARLQLELIQSQLETNETVLGVLERRFVAGQSSSADVLRQRQLVEQSREQILVAESQVAILQHALAVLEGSPAQSAGEMEAALPAVPPMPKVALPGELLERRPDVSAALYRLRSSDERIAAAVRNQYPRLDLAGSLTTAAEKPGDLFDEVVTTLAAGLVGPIYDGGARRAEVERTAAVRRQRLAEYGQTVAQAFREVEDALVLERREASRIDNLELRRQLAVTTYDQLRLQYLNGAADFLDVLSALSQQQQIERDVLTARLDRLTYRVALYRALAGGFDVPQTTVYGSDASGDALE